MEHPRAGQVEQLDQSDRTQAFEAGSCQRGFEALFKLLSVMVA